ncbi:MAG: mechanosensitive ion channel family protein [Oscillospiraceae bacterium]|nr:mechanosensitive ion channel family protein [Oscillospiraceae bacterium]
MKKIIKHIIGLVISIAICVLGCLFAKTPKIVSITFSAIRLGAIWIAYYLLLIVFQLLAKRNNRSATISSLVHSLSSYAVALFSVYFVLRAFGVDLTAALAGVGVLTLIIGFGAQSLIEDVLTGIFLIAEGKIAIGDILMIDDFRGAVVDISVRTTTIEDAGGNRKTVNNSDIRNFQNRSQTDSIAVSLISITYEADLRKVEDIIAKTLPDVYERNSDVFLSEPKYLGVDTLAESGITLKFIVPTEEKNIFTAQRRLNRELRLLFADNGINIPFPQITVHNAN